MASWTALIAGPVLVAAVGMSACGESKSADRRAGAVPPDLDRHIRRDLGTYFAKRERGAVQTDYQLLRLGPTVTGIAYPKYYAWVTTKDSAGRVVEEGAVRLAEIDTTIEVTHFFPRPYIIGDPASLDSIFPAPVIAEIKKRM